MDKFRVLIVDDEDDFRETLSLRLRNRKFIVDEAQSGEKALELLSNQDFDIIILDVLMPGMGGLACLQEIKKMKPLVEVILLTGDEEVESGIEGMRMGAFEYLEKPVPLDELIEKMELAYEKK
ncbi:MAG: response regulator [Syntrophobacteraceae bacterium]|jgi:DNA-binding NtrC family response regulator